MWTQNYDPFNNPWLSTLAAATPVCTLFYLLAVRKIHAHRAAVYAFFVAILMALLAFRMPWRLAAGAVSLGLVYAIVRICWTLLAAVFVYEITVETGHFEITPDARGLPQLEEACERKPCCRTRLPWRYWWDSSCSLLRASGRGVVAAP